MLPKIKIAVDAMGGENAPNKIINGILENYKENTVDKKIIRFVRSYNEPVDGVFDIHNWNELIPLLNSF